MIQRGCTLQTFSSVYPAIVWIMSECAHVEIHQVIVRNILHKQVGMPWIQTWNRPKRMQISQDEKEEPSITKIPIWKENEVLEVLVILTDAGNNGIGSKTCDLHSRICTLHPATPYLRAPRPTGESPAAFCRCQRQTLEKVRTFSWVHVC